MEETLTLICYAITFIALFLNIILKIWGEDIFITIYNYWWFNIKHRKSKSDVPLRGTAYGTQSYAEGCNSSAYGTQSHAEGNKNLAYCKINKK